VGAPKRPEPAADFDRLRVFSFLLTHNRGEAMTFTVALDPETEEAIVLKAAGEGLSPSDYLTLLAERDAGRGKTTAAVKNKTFGERWVEVFGDEPAGAGTSNWSEVEAPCDPH
jgi:hypothetical protein